jgi:hypothetical protein
MCRGRNGKHVHVAPGVTYCRKGETLHLDPLAIWEAVAQERPLAPYSFEASLIAGYVAFCRLHPAWYVRCILIGERGGSRKGVCRGQPA